MDPKIILGRIIQKFLDKGHSQYGEYYRFDFIELKENSLIIGRETGKDTRIPFSKLLKSITVYQENPDIYDEGPGKLRDFEITHINSPLFSLLHLLEKNAYK